MTADQTAITELLLEETPDAAVISNLGTASYHLIGVEDRARNFTMTGAMGSTTPLGLGLALATDEQVTVIDGDGSLLMSLGSLGTVAAADPPNLTIVVMDNERFETTGGQPTLSEHVDFAGVARECALPAWAVTAESEFQEAYREATDHDGAALVTCKVAAEQPDDYPDLDYAHAFTKHRFRQEFVDE